MKSSAFKTGEIVGRMDWMGPGNHDLSDDQLASCVLRHLAFLETLGVEHPEPLKDFVNGHLAGYREAQVFEAQFQQERKERM